jgi:hypothetical protein
MSRGWPWAGARFDRHRHRPSPSRAVLRQRGRWTSVISGGTPLPGKRMRSHTRRGKCSSCAHAHRLVDAARIRAGGGNSHDAAVACRVASLRVHHGRTGTAAPCDMGQRSYMVTCLGKDRRLFVSCSSVYISLYIATCGGEYFKSSQVCVFCIACHICSLYLLVRAHAGHASRTFVMKCLI